jgi:hypothetical protein
MNIGDMPGQILIITNRMLPEPSLPYGVFTLSIAGQRNPATRQGTGESGFDRPPVAGIIGIALRQGPNGMKVFRHDGYGVNRKRPLFPDNGKGFPQQVTMLNQQPGTTISQCHRKKIGSAFHPIAPV